MSSSALKLLAASGAKGEATYVDDVFSTTLYKGDNSTQTVTTGIDVLGEGGLIWVGQRTNGGGFNLIDSAQGSSYSLDTTSVNAPANNSTQLTFLNDGYRINGGSTAWDLNQNNLDYVAWSWQKQPGFFDVVTYTGNGTAGRTVSHNLGSVPGMIIVKCTSHGSTLWPVYHRAVDASAPEDYFLRLNDTNAKVDYTYWNDTAPTSTEFTLNGHDDVNQTGRTYVAYLFAHDAQDFGTDSDESIIKCGSYTGNGTTAAVEVDLGFEPQWVLVKNASSSGGAQNWHIMDSMRNWPANTSSTVGGTTEVLKPNLSSAAESSSGYYGWITSNGFSMYESNVSNSGTTYIYMAIRRPHKPAEEFAATDLFKQDNHTTTTSPKYVSGFPVDFALQNTVDETGYTAASSRLTGKQMYTPAADAEEGSPEFDYSTGFKEGSGSTNADDYAWMWRRAPGYFDVVCYTGNQTARQISHNLGAVPEMMWVKCRSQTRNWAVYAASQGNTKVANLNSTGAFTADTSSWNNTSPTSTHFTVGDGATTNFNPEPMIAYLFATVPGISKVGSYSGTGSNVNVDCGFSAGAKFILIKRADSTGDWYVWDSVRGIVAGNDPYLLLNTTAAQVTNTDYIDPLSSGFTVTSGAPAALNNNGGTYIFYAIA